MSGNTDGITTRRNDSLAHLRAVCEPWTKLCTPERATALLEAVIAPGDRVTIEGDNQKQAELLAAALANVDPSGGPPSGLEASGKPKWPPAW
jgi:malonate decarboxylase alpha subunit